MYFKVYEDTDVRGLYKLTISNIITQLNEWKTTVFDLVQAFFRITLRLNLLLKLARPPTWVTVVIVTVSLFCT